ncbi:hypothetical protein Amme_015_030 [Acidomonas methanolica NBRC 104435]|uniref:Uncharacterized protein n=1 Tax=Acidomonas methanolica NBRC 104435 TaxID=1231351 RepID=A0A023D207_ACIMT|nr:hypothetical protein Amme_015_030 [Acidomonas methanolica NBRC 104435]
MAPVLMIRDDVQEATALQAQDDVAKGGVIDGGPLCHEHERRVRMVAHGRQDGELDGGQLVVGDGGLENGRVALIGSAQQIADLLGKNVIAIFLWRAIRRSAG